MVSATPDGVRLTADVFGTKTELASVKLGQVNDVVRRGNYFYVALGGGGIEAFEAENPRAPQPVARFAEGQKVLHLAISADQLVAVTADQTALAFDLSDPSHPTVAMAPSPKRAVVPAAPASVLAAKDGVVIINAGTKEGFVKGQNVAIYSHTRISEKDRVAEAAGMEMPGMLVAVVRLERVEAERSLANYGRGDDPQAGDAVVVTDDPTTSNLAGPRWIPFEWKLGFGLRPFLGVGGEGHPFGVMTDVYVDYYMKGFPLRVEVGLTPFVLVVGGPVPYNPVVFSATVAFYSQFFEIGLGGGFSTVVVPAAPLAPQSVDTEGTLNQTLRIGAIDGVNFLWSSSIGYGSNTYELAAASAQLNFPVSTRLTLGLEGGGGRGFAYGDVVLRSYIGGVGGPGTIIVSAGLGGAGAIANQTTSVLGAVETSVNAVGPCVVFEMETRF
jgi:hypothetical protein